MSRRVDDEKLSEGQRVLANVTQNFRDLGFTLTQAVWLAEVEADWHDAKRMLENGCTTGQAFEILA